MYSFDAGTITIDSPADYANITGTNVIQVTISNVVEGSNVTEVIFSFDNGTGEFQTIGTNDTQNLTEYTFNWDTTTAGTGEGTNFTLLANVSFFNETGTDVNSSIDTNENITIDNNAPDTLTLNAPENVTNSSTQLITFNFTATDTVASILDCNLTLDPTNTSGGEVINSSTTVPNGTEMTFINTIEEGIHTWNILCLDSVSLSNQSDNQTLTVDSSTPSSVTLNNPADGANSSSTSFDFNWTVFDNIDSSLLCNLTIDSVVNQSDVESTNGTDTNFTLGGFTDGAHDWNVTCVDDAGNTNSSSTFSFTVSTSAPTITLDQPLNASTINTSVVTFNFTTVSNVYATIESCNLTLDPTNTSGGDIINSTTDIANDTVTTFENSIVDGTHIWNVQCTDSASNIGFSDNNTFTLDSIAPSVSLEFHNSNDNVQTTFEYGETVTLRCTRSDAAEFNKTIFEVQPPGGSLSTKSINLNTGSSSSTLEFDLVGEETRELGDFLVYCTVEDTAGNSNQSNATFKTQRAIINEGGSAGIKGFSNPISKIKVKEGINDVGTITVNGVSRLVGKGASLKMSINGEEHTLTVKEISDNELIITLQSTPMDVTIKKGEMKLIDLNKDGINDLSVTYHKEFQNTADISLALLSSPLKKEETEKSEKVKKNSENKIKEKGGAKPLILVSFIVLVIIVAGYFLVIKEKRRARK